MRQAIRRVSERRGGEIEDALLRYCHILILMGLIYGTGHGSVILDEGASTSTAESKHVVES